MRDSSQAAMCAGRNRVDAGEVLGLGEDRGYRQAPDCVWNTGTRRLLSVLRFPFEFFLTLLCLGSQTRKPFHRQVANELRRCEGRIVVRLPKGAQYAERIGRIEIERPRLNAVCVNHLDIASGLCSCRRHSRRGRRSPRSSPPSCRPRPPSAPPRGPQARANGCGERPASPQSCQAQKQF